MLFRSVVVSMLDINDFVTDCPKYAVPLNPSCTFNADVLIKISFVLFRYYPSVSKVKVGHIVEPSSLTPPLIRDV